ncbi:MAG TPA: DUF445 domain-containing protein [Balneolaceae bacterium]|nr:DUF445 domain-containing protein [Balneolaceae bacterium]|tara:strand:- start:100282 stop:101430 length:1149 start_codon:yes stop_codon:yes gene_type:complete
MESEEKKDSIVKVRSKQFGSQLWKLVSDKLEEKGGTQGIPKEYLPPPQHRSKFHWLINLLYIFPLILLGGFVLSFFWDFNDLSVSPFGFEIALDGIMRILTISGLIGFLTNWLAIKMLFKPSTRRPILGQGLIPAQKDRIAYRLARAVSQDLINPEIIKQRIHESNAIAKYREKATEYIRTVIDDPQFRSDLKLLVVGYVDEMIAEPEVRAKIAKTIIEQIEGSIDQNSFERVALKAYSFLKGQEMQDLVEDALTKLPAGVEKGLDKLDDFLDTLPDRIEQNSEVIENLVTNLLYKLINQLDVHALVEDNLRKYDEQRLEMLIKNASNDQLRYIQYLGAVLGTLGGFIIWKPVASLLVLALLILITLGIDSALIRIQRSKDI